MFPSTFTAFLFDGQLTKRKIVGIKALLRPNAEVLNVYSDLVDSADKCRRSKVEMLIQPVPDFTDLVIGGYHGFFKP